MIDTVIFDFDGTIADSERLMRASFNAIANEFGYQPLSPDESPQLRRMSLRQFVGTRLHIPLWRILKLRRLERRAKEEYVKQGAMLGLFAGMTGIISELRLNGYKVGIVSSAPQQIVEVTLRDASTSIDFIRAGNQTMGKASALRRVLREFGLDKERVVYVGDELRDIDACRRAGISMIGVGWGLNDAPTLRQAGVKVASTPSELFSMITNTA